MGEKISWSSWGGNRGRAHPFPSRLGGPLLGARKTERDWGPGDFGGEECFRGRKLNSEKGDQETASTNLLELGCSRADRRERTGQLRGGNARMKSRGKGGPFGNSF